MCKKGEEGSRDEGKDWKSKKVPFILELRSWRILVKLSNGKLSA